MATSRMTTPLYSTLSLFLLATLAGCTTLPSASVKTNVPSDRLSSATYTTQMEVTGLPSLTSMATPRLRNTT